MECQLIPQWSSLHQEKKKSLLSHRSLSPLHLTWGVSQLQHPSQWEYWWNWILRNCRSTWEMELVLPTLPTKQAKGDSGTQTPLVTEMEKKPWGETLLHQGAVLLLPDETSMAWFNSRLQHRSDCAEHLSGSRGIVPI